jgi:hypothetical protein
MSETRVPLTADQVAEIVAYGEESKRMLSLRDTMIRGIALGVRSAKELDGCRFIVNDDVLVISKIEAPKP